MSKYKIGDVFVSDRRAGAVPAFKKAEIVAFNPHGDAILEIIEMSDGRHHRPGDLVARHDDTLSKFYTLVKPKPAFFEVDKFYRFDGACFSASSPYIRYEIKEVFETPQDDGTVFLQAHAEMVGPSFVRQTFLNEGDFEDMVKM